MALRKTLNEADFEDGPVVVATGMTADSYFALPQVSQPQNLIEGRLYMSPSPFWKHQRVVGTLFVPV